MPIAKDLRLKKLEELINEKPYMTGIRVLYEGQTREFQAFKIPLTYLIYNKYNGRIGSLVKSFEVQYSSINPENEDDIRKIEKFLWDSKPERNKTTLNDLVSNGQQKYGIVTNDGVIIDGNRRAMLLNKIWVDREKWQKSNQVDHSQYFIAIILPSGAETKEILRLETTYQMGEDEKLDYNPIEKYIKCKDLKGVGFSSSDIARMMGEKKSTIETWLEILILMESYLDHFGYDGIYTRLEKREGQFVDLSRYLKIYENGTKYVKWNYGKSDISDLKIVCFDYIRAGYEGKEFRYIAQPHKSDSIFCNEDVWKEFINRYSESVEPINENEKSVEDYRTDNPEADLSILLETRDGDWNNDVKNLVTENLNRSKSVLEDIRNSDRPEELLKRSLNALNSINTEVESFIDDKIEHLLKEINSKSHTYRKLVQDGLKHSK